MNVNKRMDDCKRGCIGYSQVFSCDRRPLVQHCGQRRLVCCTALSCAHATLTATFTENNSILPTIEVTTRPRSRDVGDENTKSMESIRV